MKNKEIEEFDKKQLEELLKRLKDINNFIGFKDGAFKYYLGKYEADLLLSYIEQLQTTANECKQDYQRMKENFDSKVDVIATLSEEKKQLENNRDKALKIIESYELGKYDYSIPPGGIIELRDVLRGDSDE